MIAGGRARDLALLACAVALAATAASCSWGGSHVASPAVTSEPLPPGSQSSGGIEGPPPTVKVHVPAAPTGPVKSVPDSIARDCSVDVSGALESWIASVPDNSTVAFPSKACYRVDETVVIDGRRRLLLDGHGATLKSVTMGKRNRAQLRLFGGSDLTVRNLIVRGANPHAGPVAAAYVAHLEAQHAFQVSGATNVLLDRVQAYDTYGDFVYIGPGDKRPSRNVTVANSRFARSGRQGISVTSAVGVTIEANTIDGVARSVFDLEANNRAAAIRDVRIVGNVTGVGVNFWLANKGFAADIGNIQLVGNRMAAPTGGLVLVFARRGKFRSPIVIENNHFVFTGKVTDEDSPAAFFLAYAADVTIRGNDVEFPKGKNLPAVEIRNSHHVEVTDNHFDNAGKVIVASDGSTDYRAS